MVAISTTVLTTDHLSLMYIPGMLETVVGVDLGTTFSVVAVNKHGVVHVINDSITGDPLVPSIVAYLPDKELVVGNKARQRLAVDPMNTIYNAKRFIGRDTDDPVVEMEIDRHPFKVVPHVGNHSGVGFVIDAPGHPQVVTPEDVGSRVLLHLLDMTAEALGYRQVNKAVITVPAKFDPRQKRATGEAYKKAGLKVTRVLEEPTAAAIAYGLHQKPNVHHIMVYDFGGGTLDVSLLYVHKGFVTVSGTDGDEHLGGADFDYCLAENLVSRYGDFTAGAEGSSKDTSIEMDFDQRSTKGTGLEEEHECSSYTLLAIAEHLKRMVSFSDRADFRCRVGDRMMEVEVTRAQFEHACEPIFKRALAPVDGVLETLGMKTSEIDEVVMVGGTTRIPRVREMLKQHLQIDSLNTHIDPDVTVAFGAACVVD